MEITELPEANISIEVPVKIDYQVLEEHLQEKMIGEVIKNEKESGKISNYAEILDLHLEKSPYADFDLAIDIKFKTLISIFQNREVAIRILISLEFDLEGQELRVNDYKIKGNSESWLMNKAIQTVGNHIIQNRIINLMKFDFGILIEKQVKSLNEKLEKHLEAHKGVFITGYVDRFDISEFQLGQSCFLLTVKVLANVVVDIKKIVVP